ncbi:hypothetical protein BU26DRAFT_67511 [Trematosphaeria pertusa]|uniref:Uncharacterized protein n=1 Tax=Trematosphaeria pertusa TaxID=390896 RepID=A0A6A6I4W3_9PLEO|nr:uncharacterized protein BU26DRAFT_67511 [Trematosphaeria pertusa]KAF2245357.1 hypothetical protein BU26DRAFT_67511 [Trematosphaeria pertusa]
MLQQVSRNEIIAYAVSALHPHTRVCGRMRPFLKRPCSPAPDPIRSSDPTRRRPWLPTFASPHSVRSKEPQTVSLMHDDSRMQERRSCALQLDYRSTDLRSTASPHTNQARTKPGPSNDRLLLPICPILLRTVRCRRCICRGHSSGPRMNARHSTGLLYAMRKSGILFLELLVRLTTHPARD